MKVLFEGAAKEVTGSCIYIKDDSVDFLVDCGFFQGENSYLRNLEDFSFDPKQIDFVLLTHAHLDHCGRLPLLFNRGFRGRIYSTKATKELALLILEDLRKVHSEIDFNLNAIKGSFRCFDYGEENEIFSGIKIRFRDAGHILGSSIIELWKNDKKIVFSGDLGNDRSPIMRDTEMIDEADYVFIESTYGGKIHPSREEGSKKLKEIVLKTIKDKSTLIIPTFALERTQEMIYELNYLVENKKIPHIKVFLDSPLAIKANNIYKKHKELYDNEALEAIEKGDDIFEFFDFEETLSGEDSQRAIQAESPKIILAGSGMCEGGRIPTYLKIYLKDKKSYLLFISFQAKGTNGRRILEGDKEIDIDGKKYRVGIKVDAIHSFSSHADQKKLLKWVGNIKGVKKIFIEHGEEDQSVILKENIKNIETIIPDEKSFYNLD